MKNADASPWALTGVFHLSKNTPAEESQGIIAA
jgi:hypothetical protein